MHTPGNEPLGGDVRACDCSSALAEVDVPYTNVRNVRASGRRHESRLDLPLALPGQPIDP